ncbi:MAG: ATP-dependent DNA helicase RecQ [Ginsengibacter sp.]
MVSKEKIIESPHAILKKYWGYEAFRPKQEEVIMSIMNGYDTLAIMPTGGGKSLCFQVPAMAKEGMCLVITPLIALMKDQVANLKQKGIPALSIYSGMHFREILNTLKNAAYGNFKFLYVSPERLETELFAELLPRMNINLVAVDEAHCISQWGYDFRPKYLKIADIRSELDHVPILALTASATVKVQNDICDKLSFGKEHQKFQASFERANLSYSVFEMSGRQQKMVDILMKVPGSAIVYCKSRKRTKEIAEILRMNGIAADNYHAGLSNEERNKKQDEWLSNSTRIMTCTNAFGMGIDKPDVRTVIHYDVPEALENYYQEAGRAGRDGKKAYAVLFFNETEIATLQKQSDIRFPSKQVIRNVYQALVNYFQLPTGNGENLSFDFDINDFVKKFKFEVIQVSHVLKILEQEELINYSDHFFSPSTFVFTTTKSTLEVFEKSHPHLETIIKGILRSYDGVFDYPAIVRESDLARFLSMNKEMLKFFLNELHAFGIIEYIPQKDNPQIVFLENRVTAENLVVNETNILKRKEAFDGRLRAMFEYTLERNKCRSKMIASYFNDKNLKKCGVCDNCLREKQIKVSKVEFNSITHHIKIILSERDRDTKELIAKMPEFSEKKIKKVLRYLLEEDIISVNRQGTVRNNTL